MENAIKRIAIVGGGTAGWMTAAHFANHFQPGTPGAPEIVLIESEEIGIIGVGEATIPSIKTVLDNLGIDEFEFMRETSATFKQAIKFVDWLHEPGTTEDNSYFHTFQLPFKVKGRSAVPYWLEAAQKKGISYVDYAVPQGKICDAGLAPMQYRGGQKQAPLVHAYHFDANQCAHFLKGYSTSRGVVHRLGSVQDVLLDEQGNIKELQVKDQEPLSADLFIDCTGFAAVLIEKKLGSTFRSMNPVLFCDRAVTMQVPYDDPNAPIKPYTTSTAKANGWIWDIGLNTRRGIGYVYSSRHTSQDEAEEVLREYIGPASLGKMPRHLPMRVGYRDDQWVKNCIALGLSAGFLEPLESTGIAQVTTGLSRLLHTLSLRGDNDYARRQYNEQMSNWYALVIEFVKLHYCLTKRTDTAFWRENVLPETIPERLQEQMKAWKYRPVEKYDIDIRHVCFGEGNYEQILLGMKYLPDLTGQESSYPFRSLAGIRQVQVEKQTKFGLSMLPKHRDVINQIYAG